MFLLNVLIFLNFINPESVNVAPQFIPTVLVCPLQLKYL